MSLKLNQTRLYKYMTHLVDALNAKNAELHEARTALEAEVGYLTNISAYQSSTVAVCLLVKQECG